MPRPCASAAMSLPRAQPWVDREVVDRVEARVRAVEGPVEGQHVHAAEEPGQRPVQQAAQRRQRAAEPVGVGDQLDLVGHPGLPGELPQERAVAGSALSGSPRSRHSRVCQPS